MRFTLSQARAVLRLLNFPLIPFPLNKTARPDQVLISVRGDVNSPAKLSGHMDENPTTRELRIFSPNYFYKISISDDCRLQAATTEGQFVTLRKYSKHLPWALPAIL